MTIKQVENNSGDAAALGSLPNLLGQAQDGDAITFDPAVFTGGAANTISLTSPLQITHSLTIEGHLGGGSGAPNITLDGGNATTVMNVSTGVTAAIDGLVIAHGYGTGAAGATGTAGSPTGTPGGDAAGGIVNSGNLTVTNSVFQQDVAQAGNGGAGASYTISPVHGGGGPGGNAAGAIYNEPGSSLVLGLGNILFSGNHATGGNGGPGGDGGIINSGQKTQHIFAGGSGGGGAHTDGGPYDAQAGGAGEGPGGNQAGAPGGAPSHPGQSSDVLNTAGGGGGGGSASADFGGAQTSFMTVAALPCYCRGTRILTTRGEVPIEALSVGDVLITASGVARPAIWIGSTRRRITEDNRHSVAPILIARGALADNVPHRDLCVSPGHSLLIDGVLATAGMLVNGCSVRRCTDIDEVEYCHLELPVHDAVLAEGAWAETYLDVGNRDAFEPDAVGPIERAGHGRTCAVEVEEGPILAEIWCGIAARAGIATAADPDLRLCVNGHTVRPSHVDDVVCRFEIAGQLNHLRLLSRSGVPSELGIAKDGRRLGVGVSHIVIKRRYFARPLEFGAESLRAGIYTSDQKWRWTNGDALLPRVLYYGEAVIDVHVVQTLPFYPVTAAANAPSKTHGVLNPGMVPDLMAASAIGGRVDRRTAVSSISGTNGWIRRLAALS